MPMTVTPIHSCPGQEYETAKYVLSMEDQVTTEIAVGHLWRVEQSNCVKDLALVGAERIKRHIRCWRWGKMEHFQLGGGTA